MQNVRGRGGFVTYSRIGCGSDAGELVPHQKRSLVRGVWTPAAGVLAGLIMCIVAVAHADQPSPTASATRADGPSYPANGISIAYKDPAQAPVNPEELESVPITLGRVSDGYVAPRPDVPSATTTLRELGASGRIRLYGSAIHTIDETLVQALNARGLGLVTVRPNADDIDPRSSVDRRVAEGAPLRLEIILAKVRQIRSFGSGERLAGENPIDNKVHARIRENSPVHDGDTLRIDQVNDYVDYLNRQPGRRISATLSPTREPGGVYLDYLIAEDKPWALYFQGSNTGTNTTTPWRERFGYSNTQVTNCDDVFRFDYITGGFNTVNGLYGSYEIPLPRFGDAQFLQRFRFHMDGNWGQYNASQLGLDIPNFTGKQGGLGAQIIDNVFQFHRFFIDVLGGWRWEEILVDNPTASPQKLDTSLSFAQFGARFERIGDTNEFHIETLGEVATPDALNAANRTLLQTLGRPFPNRNWVIMRWNVLSSAFLEPFVNWMIGGAKRYDPGTMEYANLANELVLTSRGQYAPFQRLVPQEELTAGGLYSVRGYQQSIIVGDTVAIGSLEYRLHIPALLGLVTQPVEVPLGGLGGIPRVMRLTPGKGLRPDWDFAIRAFIEGGLVASNDTYQANTSTFEKNDTPLGVGAGFTVTLFRNINFTFDWGHAVFSVGIPPFNENAGANHFYTQLTMLY